MKTIHLNKSLIALIVFAIAGAILVGSFINTPAQVAEGNGFGHLSRKCTVNATSSVTVGAGSSKTILSANSNRAWARIQNRLNATNTVSINFDAAATTNSGLQLVGNNASATPAFIDMGLNNDFPFVGSVTARTNAGSSTIRVVQCVY